ncbi:hypothetical protein QLQ12_02255 [Actinoplanes sp. NEAU-A12]|uniref:Uncharacterized protein n=1 Tax=Actinoplanes sandaracinus TaxID=3045177 RepID=A0ABT6WCE3_9ACTN|nr:hypothetical protein [Actinoplanes sandaracinus]MDI6097422.1 hypothetical protein [Actinoplanes sandaracinus]
MSGPDLRYAADRVTELADRLAPRLDPVGPERLTELLTDFGWAPAPQAAGFTTGELTARVEDDRIVIDLPDFGLSNETGQERHDEAVAAMNELAELLNLPPAGPFDRDDNDYHPDEVLLRSGHWVVHLLVANEGDDIPIILEVAIAYGADLPGRLAQLAGPPAGQPPVDWEAVTTRTGVQLPDDHRWLLENYGTAPIGGRITLYDPRTLGKPVPGPERPLGIRHQLLPVAAADGQEIFYALDWEITGLEIAGRAVSTSLLHHVVVTLAGGDR